MNNTNFLKAGFFTLVAVMSSHQVLAADVGVSVSIGQPGFYGRLDIGDYPYPQPYLINPRPVIIQPQVGVEYEPIYMHVPPGHAKRWRSYCGRYNACDRPVYFVQDRWYNDEYAPRYREHHGYDRGEGDRDRGYDRDRGGDRGRGGEDRGRDEGRGRGDGGHGRGNDRGRD